MNALTFLWSAGSPARMLPAVLVVAASGAQAPTAPFAPCAPVATAGLPRAAALLDANRDGSPDLVIAEDAAGRRGYGEGRGTDA